MEELNYFTGEAGDTAKILLLSTTAAPRLHLRLRRPGAHDQVAFVLSDGSIPHISTDVSSLSPL